MKRLFILIMLMGLSLPIMSFSSDKETLLGIADILKEVESNNNPKAIGDDGLAFGVLQIHKACVEDVNRFYGTQYTHEDAFNPIIAEDIFVKYLSMGIKLYTKKCGFPPSEDEIVRMWNGGIYRGYLYKDTMPYLQKYIIQKALMTSQTQVALN